MSLSSFYLPALAFLHHLDTHSFYSRRPQGPLSFFNILELPLLGPTSLLFRTRWITFHLSFLDNSIRRYSGSTSRPQYKALALSTWHIRSLSFLSLDYTSLLVLFFISQSAFFLFTSRLILTSIFNPLTHTSA